MKVRFRNGVYVRHFGNESVVWCPRCDGFILVKDAKPFLTKFSNEWKLMDDIVREVGREFECTSEGISEDVHEVFSWLESQKFIELDGRSTYASIGWDVANEVVKQCEVSKPIENDEENELSLFWNYCQRHKLLSVLHMDLTDRCNETCVHCYIPKGGGTMMPTELAVKVLREFRAMEGLTVYVSGGECMLHPDFKEILREAKRLGLNIIVMSNLTLCDAKMVTLLNEIDPQFVNVSLYSMKAEEHDAITRVPESWMKTMAAIRALKEAGVHVRLATPIMRENRDAVDALQKFAFEMQMHDVIDCDIFGRMNHDCSNQSHALGLNEAECVIRKYKDQLCHQELVAERCAPDAKVCDIGEVKLNINARGDYYPCDGGHGIVLGNAATDSLADVWKGEKLNELRALKNRDFPKCVGCANRAWCKVCVMRNFNETGDLFTPAPERCARAVIHRKIWEEK